MKMNEKDLLFYVDRGDSDNVKKILKDPNIDPNVNYDGRSLLHHFCHVSFDIVKELLAHPKIDPNIKDEYGKTVLYYNCYFGGCDLQNVKELLTHPKIDPNIQHEDGNTALHKMRYVKALLAHPKIDPNIQNEFGKTVLHNYASRVHKWCFDYCNISIGSKTTIEENKKRYLTRRIDKLKELLAHPKIDPNIQDCHGKTALHKILDCCNTPNTLRTSKSFWYAKYAKELLAHPKIDINIQDEDGNTTLHKAFVPEVVKLLLAHSEIEVNIQNEFGETALHMACKTLWRSFNIFKGFMYASEFERRQYGCYYKITDTTDIVKSFLEHPDFDPTIQDEDGKTILDLFSDEDEFIEITTLLKNFIKEKEQQTTEEFCLAMIQPTLPVSTMTKKRKAKELRRDELRLPPEITKLIATYLEWTHISKKSCFEIRNIKEMA